MDMKQTYLERVAGRELAKVVRVVQLLHVHAVCQFRVIGGCSKVCQAVGHGS